MHRPDRPKNPLRLAALCLAAAVTLAACSPTSDPDAATELRVYTHDSFDISDEEKARFETETGLTTLHYAPGNAGTVLNELILSKDHPVADVVFGIDNTFASRAIDAGVLAPHTSPALPDLPSGVAADASGHLTPIDFGAVCVNADDAWFAAHDLAVPATFDDLTKPEYKGLLVVTNPATSSPGLAFLIATVGAKGEDGYLDYWAALRDNGVKVAASWSDAYSVDFSGSSGQGSYPLVVSYVTSPLSEEATSNLDRTCFRQVEYAAVVAGTGHEADAGQYIDFLLSEGFQSEIPDTMWMYPVNPSATLPAGWADAAAAIQPVQVSAADIGAHREEWIERWTETVL